MNEGKRKYPWFYPIKTMSPFRESCIYIDTIGYLADRLFQDAGVKVAKTNIFYRDGDPYRIVLCSFWKKDAGKFMQAMQMLPDKALICGWTDYMDYANKLFADAKQLRKSGRLKFEGEEEDD